MQLATLTLNLPLHPGDLPGFRAAIAETVGFEHEIFHNHDAKKPAGYGNWRYPLIQYGVRRGHATVTGIGSPGAEAVRRILLPLLPFSLAFAGRRVEIEEYEFREKAVDCSLTDTPTPFGLFGWLSLNKDNYAAWKQAPTEADRLAILGRALTGQLRSLARTLDICPPHQVEGRVLQVDNQKMIRWHGVQLVRFNAQVEANLQPPFSAGLGRMAAFGFGEILPVGIYRQFTCTEPAVLQG